MATPQQPQVTFVVVGWNNRNLLAGCFNSIKSQTYKNLSIIFVDNGSADNSVEFTRENFPDIKVVDVGQNNGFAIGNNIGIKEALKNTDCQYVALLNTDATLANDWLKTLVGFADKHPNSGSFQTATYDYYDRSVLDSYGIVVDHKGRAMQLGYRSKHKTLDTRIVFGTNAAASLYSASFLKAQPFGEEYFDEDLWMYLEDVDLAARATVMGLQNWFVGSSAAYHMGSASSSKNPGFSVFYIYRNNFPMLYKNFPGQIILRLIPGLIATDFMTIIDLLRGRNKIALKALVRGRLHGIALLSKMHRKRQLLKTRRLTSSAELWRLMASE